MTSWLAMAAMVMGLAGWLAAAEGDGPTTRPASSVLDLTVQDASGKAVNLSEYRGKVLMLVNVASKCGFTPQYEQLEQIYRKYKDQGFVVLAFPADDFGHQEPGTNEEIQQFCRTKFDVTFPVFGKLVTKGEGKSSLYQFLTSRQTNGEFAGEIGWNFTKFLVSRDGKVVARYPSQVKPDDAKVIGAMEAEIAKH